MVNVAYSTLMLFTNIDTFTSLAIVIYFLTIWPLQSFLYGLSSLMSSSLDTPLDTLSLFPFSCIGLKIKNHRFLHRFFYLFELLNLGLLKHGEDIGAGLLCSPLSLIGGLLTCLKRCTQTHSVYS